MGYFETGIRCKGMAKDKSILGHQINQANWA